MPFTTRPLGCSHNEKANFNRVSLPRITCRWSNVLFGRSMRAPHFILLALVLTGCSSAGTHRASTLTADQAKALARQLANERAGSIYGSQPFWNGAPARFVQGRWVWNDRRACGNCDVEATVSFAADGSSRAVDVVLLDTRTSEDR